MSFNFTASKKPLSTFSLAGLTDIVLLLLIFFLLTSNFIPQFGIQVNLPQAEAASSPDEQYITVVITAEGNYFVNNQQVPRDNLLDAIRDAKGSRTAMVLRADRDATVGQFARVASIAKALDLRVLMATEREDLRPR